MSRCRALLVAALVASATGCTNWEAHEYPDRGFRAEFAGTPRAQPVTSEPGELGTRAKVEADFPEELFASVTVNERQAPFPEGSDDPEYRGNDSAERWFSIFTELESGYRQYRQSNVESGGLEGFEAIEVERDDAVLDVTLDAPLDDIYALQETHAMRRVRYYIDREGRRVFAVALKASAGNGEALRGSVAERFFNSFEIIGDK